MGTRGAVGFRKDGKDELSYNHWDSYPSGLGVSVLDYCRSHTIAEMSAVASKLVLVTEDSHLTDQQVQDHIDALNTSVGRQSVDDVYCLLREAQGSLGFYDVPGHYLMIDSHTFLADSLFCEWAYIINLDEGVLECYRGFNKDAKAPGRYAALKDRDYQGVALVKTYPLSSLPDNGSFEAELDPRDAE